MGDRVIFWLSADLLPFCISYFFQKNNNSELFGIYDLTINQGSFLTDRH